MIFRQKWLGKMVGEDTLFPVSVPGNIQKDYADFNNWGDLNYGTNCKRYLEIEDKAWEYITEIEYKKESDERIYFVSGGIDYIFDIIVNDEIIFSHEGMFTPIEIDITDKLKGNKDVLKVAIHPHPVHNEAQGQLISDCKPPVSWGWDWHPRVVPSGIWNDAYIETRKDDYINDCEVFFELSEDYQKATVHFKIECNDTPTIEFSDKAGNIVYSGKNVDFTIDNPNLWWCNGQGEAYLYSWRAYTKSSEKRGKIGFKTIELVKNAVEANDDFPITRDLPPATLKLNGRKIFGKGSNWVNPEVFTGFITRETYEPLVKLAKEANMNLFRCWGGAGCHKESFYDLCDEYGILVWQEFPLACNDYSKDEHYLEILEQEAKAIIKLLRSHASVALWCGGNELFNSWSGLDDQSFALRLLNKVCYEEDKTKPFIPTSPIMGMSHGGYLFDYSGKDFSVYNSFNNSYNTTYTEFGVPSISSADYLRSFVPTEELFPIRKIETMILHHAIDAWCGEPCSWACVPVLEKYFGKSNSIEELCERSMWTQCEGYKAAFEEARRQKPHCSMAVNWCYNEPWKIVANNTIINYPDIPKKSYYAVRDALRDVMPSARLNKFKYSSNENFEFEAWILNDTQAKIQDEVEIYIEIADKKIIIDTWKTEVGEVNSNIKGKKYKVELPKVDTDRFKLILDGKNTGKSEYLLRYDK